MMMITMLCCSCGLLDAFESSKLDLVDKIVFDAQQTDMRVRVEALSFLLDHTVGFEPAATGAAAAGEKKKGKGGASAVSGGNDSFFFLVQDDQ